MKKGLKRILSVVLALTMILGMSMSTFAASTQQSHSDLNETLIKGAVSIKVLSKEAKGADLNFRLYKIIDVYDSKEGDTHSDSEEEKMIAEASSMQWASEALKNAVAGYTGVSVDLTNPANLSDLTTEEIDAFYQWLAKQIRADEDTNTFELTAETHTGTPGNGADGLTYVYNNGSVNGQTEQKLEVGGYIALADDGANVYRPTVISAVPTRGTDGKLTYPENLATVEMKHSTLSIDKQIRDGYGEQGSTDFGDDATVAEGDRVTFRITTAVPVYAGDYDATKIQYVMADIYRNSYAPDLTTLKVTGYATADEAAAGTNGALLTGKYAVNNTATVYSKDNEPLYMNTNNKFYGLDGENFSSVTTAEAALNTYNTTHQSSVTDPVTTEYGGFAVDFTGNYNEIKNYKVIVYEYEAVITSSEALAAETNTNMANLGYSVNAYEPEKPNNIEDEVKSYTYGITVEKVDGLNSNTKLNGVEFDLYKNIGTMTEAEYEALNKGTDGLDYKQDVADDGTITVWKRIKHMTTEGLDGSNNPLGQATIERLDAGEYRLYETKAPDGYNKLTDPITVELTPLAADKKFLTGGTTAVYTTQVQNFQGVTLPSTGGMGTTVFTFSGIALMGTAMVLIMMKRRREEA